jgi:hypothetical protein
MRNFAHEWAQQKRIDLANGTKPSLSDSELLQVLIVESNRPSPCWRSPVRKESLAMGAERREREAAWQEKTPLAQAVLENAQRRYQARRR